MFNGPEPERRVIERIWYFPQRPFLRGSKQIINDRTQDQLHIERQIKGQRYARISSAILPFSDQALNGPDNGPYPGQQGKGTYNDMDLECK